MPGPLPGSNAMHPDAVARRNKHTTRAELPVLPAEDRAAIEVPELPSDRLWDPRVSDFWTAAWQSPMRLEWDLADHPQLLRMAYLLHEFYTVADDTELASIKRAAALAKLNSALILSGARLGLDPFARRSLQWMLVRTEQAEAETAATKAATTTGAKKATARKRRGLKGLE
jgi:hypothetical protein